MDWLALDRVNPQSKFQPGASLYELVYDRSFNGTVIANCHPLVPANLPKGVETRHVASLTGAIPKAGCCGGLTARAVL
ncbi:MAG: hypothetical protein KME26_05005 [Oscillatoria princeps RMCB-10]|nr:hypothetical protein [Oscillatoria princeps RMCB-10]